MTKKELVDQIAEKRGMSAQEVLSVVEDLMKLVKRNVAAGDSVYLRGFGVSRAATPGESRTEHYQRRTVVDSG